MKGLLYEQSPPLVIGTSLIFEACIKLMADWLYEEVGKIFLPDPKLCDQINPELHVPVIAFIENVNRLRAFWALYPHLVEMASLNVRQQVQRIEIVKEPD